MGAWIETADFWPNRLRPAVAPRVGAWIETHYFKFRLKYHPSLPVWERGLKPNVDSNLVIAFRVAPRVGAWIETS